MAIYLDPRFAMPRLHLGLLARRAGERTRAHDELGRALDLLAREEPSRILLFGGGFSREAGLADSSGTRERDKANAVAREQAAYQRELARAPDQFG